MSFANKVVLVTGASSGIGAATAILFAKRGANVVMVGRNQTKLNAVAAKVGEVGKKPLVINADVSRDNDAERIIADAIATFGQLDVLVNNAGMAKSGTILDGKVVEAYDACMSVNVRAVINLTSLAAPYLAATKGNIVNVSSIGAITPPPYPIFLAYYVSKAAVDHFTRGAALELASRGIRVNNVNPGPVITDFMENMGLEVDFEAIKPTTPLGRISDPEEVADLIVYLANDKVKGVTGANFVIDNGVLLRPS